VQEIPDHEAGARRVQETEGKEGHGRPEADAMGRVDQPIRVQHDRQDAEPDGHVPHDPAAQEAHHGVVETEEPEQRHHHHRQQGDGLPREARAEGLGGGGEEDGDHGGGREACQVDEDHDEALEGPWPSDQESPEPVKRLVRKFSHGPGDPTP
jgi:hypothetical protein